MIASHLRYFSMAVLRFGGSAKEKLSFTKKMIPFENK